MFNVHLHAGTGIHFKRYVQISMQYVNVMYKLV